MGITFKTLLNCLPAITNVSSSFPIMLRSRHGVGKSSVVYQFADKINMRVVERRASQMTEGDLLGLPKINNDRTEWLHPSWFKDACENPVVLFIDELDRATTEVRQGFFELCDSRKIAGLTLHENTLIFAAINGGEYSSQYQVGELDPAELDRWVVFDIEPSLEDWLEWGKNNIQSVILEFVSKNPNYLELEPGKIYEPNKVYPSRRSWHRLSEVLKTSPDLLKFGEISPELYNITAGFLGIETAISFTDFVKKYKNLVQPKDILCKGNIKLVENFTLNDHIALIEQMDAQKLFQSKLSKKQLNNLGEYAKILPSEALVKLWSELGKTENDCNNIIGFDTIDGMSMLFVESINISENESKNKNKSE